MSPGFSKVVFFPENFCCHCWGAILKMPTRTRESASNCGKSHQFPQSEQCTQNGSKPIPKNGPKWVPKMTPNIAPKIVQKVVPKSSKKWPRDRPKSRPKHRPKSRPKIVQKVVQKSSKKTAGNLFRRCSKLSRQPVFQA